MTKQFACSPGSSLFPMHYDSTTWIVKKMREQSNSNWIFWIFFYLLVEQHTPSWHTVLEKIQEAGNSIVKLLKFDSLTFSSCYLSCTCWSSKMSRQCVECVNNRWTSRLIFHCHVCDNGCFLSPFFWNHEMLKWNPNFKKKKKNPHENRAHSVGVCWWCLICCTMFFQGTWVGGLATKWLDNSITSNHVVCNMTKNLSGCSCTKYIFLCDPCADEKYIYSAAVTCELPLKPYSITLNSAASLLLQIRWPTLIFIFTPAYTFPVLWMELRCEKVPTVLDGWIGFDFHDRSTFPSDSVHWLTCALQATSLVLTQALCVL